MVDFISEQTGPLNGQFRNAAFFGVNGHGCEESIKTGGEKGKVVLGRTTKRADKTLTDEDIE